MSFRAQIFGVSCAGLATVGSVFDELNCGKRQAASWRDAATTEQSARARRARSPNAKHQAPLKVGAGAQLCAIRQDPFDQCPGKNHGVIVLWQGCRRNIFFQAKRQFREAHSIVHAKSFSVERFLAQLLEIVPLQAKSIQVDTAAPGSQAKSSTYAPT